MLNRQFQAPGVPERRAHLSSCVTSPALILPNALGALPVKLTDSQVDYHSELLADKLADRQK
jgi:hypothetical protein